MNMKDKVDDVTRLAMNIYSNKGVYVPLLGSGISLAAGIMSGWKVTEDLLKKLARMEEGSKPDDVFKWYKEKYHRDAEYSDLLSQLGHESAEIGNLLWSYFEASDEDRKMHMKEPTEAHKAIAEMAGKGYFKVIITTNFDRLLEMALDKHGLKYQVVSSETQLEGAVPIIHFPLTILKINGDYKDSRVKNTDEELTNYSEEWNDYLCNILKDFGLITCGWSATWDKALIKDIERNKGHKYSYNFTYVDKAKSQEILSLSDVCKGEAFCIDGADKFFADLSEKIKALEIIHEKDMEIDKEIAVTRVKEYIKRSEDIIRYTDLFENETSKAIAKANEFTYTHESLSAQLYEHIYSTAYANLSVLIPMGIVAARWADSNHCEAIVNALSDMANRPIGRDGIWTEEARKQNHAIDTVFLYGIGVACVYYRNFDLLDRLFKVKLNDATHLYSNYLIDIANCWLIDKDTWNRTVVAGTGKKTPFSWLFSNLLRPSFPFINTDEEFDAYFCIFEKLLAMYYYMLISDVQPIEEFRMSAPIGQFGWQSLYFLREKNNKYITFFNEIDAQKDNAPQIKGGLFDKDYSRYTEVMRAVTEIEKRARPGMM